jgi:hypothetical protein
MSAQEILESISQASVVKKGNKMKKIVPKAVKKPLAKKKKISDDSDSEDHLNMTMQEVENQYSNDVPFTMKKTMNLDSDSDDLDFEKAIPQKVQQKKIIIESDENDELGNKPVPVPKPNIVLEVVEERRERKFLDCMSILRPLTESNFDITEETNFPPEQLIQMLDTIISMWTPDDPKDLTELSDIVRRCLGLNNSDNITPYDVEVAMDKNIFMPIHNLKARFLIAHMISNPSYDRSSEFESKFSRLYMIQSYGVEVYYNAVLWHHRLQNPDLDIASSSIGVLRYMPREDYSDMKDFLKFLTYCMLKLQTRRYRRYKGAIYRPIYNSKGYFTNAWEFHQEIKDFVWGAVDPDRQGHMFKIMYSRGTSHAEQAIKVLTYMKTNYFPELEPDRYLSSWRNGIYNVHKDKFYPYDKRNPYANNAKKPTMEALKKNSTETLKSIRELAEKLPRFSAVFEGIASEIEAELEGGKPVEENIFIGGSFCSSIYIDQDFVDQSHVDWKKIQTPNFQDILNDQKFNEETCKWIYALMGRGLYWCGDMNKENWQFSTIFLGHSGTGKSTLLKYLRKFFRIENVGILSNNIERQWAMSTLVDKHIVIGYEIKSDFQWDQAEFQQCAACEELLVAKKHKEAFVSTWRTPIFMAANEMIKCWRDNSGSLQRRLVVIPFRYYVPPANVNPNLMEDLQGEFSLWIQKINKAYQMATADYGSKEIWSVLPQQLKEASEETMQSVHPLMVTFFINIKLLLLTFSSTFSMNQI